MHDAADGCEATLDSVEHCGSCQTRCEYANARARCQGSCAIERCDERYADCDGLKDNGCERRLHTLSDCSDCGEPCGAPNAITTCEGGRCRFLDCAAGFGDCNGDATKLGGGDGCETRLDRPEQCGACDTQCGGTTPYCSGGRCTAIVCDSGRADCDEDDLVCETDLHSLENCGGCGVPCGPLPNAAATCASGQCAASCRSGFRDCDSMLANGCETDVHTNSDCGQCGLACSFENATASCASGSCVFGSCNAGWGDCNQNSADGCEQRLNTTDHCGACGLGCELASAASSCSGGSCQVAGCDPGFGNCDGQPATVVRSISQTIRSTVVAVTSPAVRDVAAATAPASTRGAMKPIAAVVVRCALRARPVAAAPVRTWPAISTTAGPAASAAMVETRIAAAAEIAAAATRAPARCSSSVVRAAASLD